MKCQAQHCSGEVVARGLCQKHYMRFLRHGSIEQTRSTDWGTREKHPLYGQWTGMRRKGQAPIDPVWEDFWQFVKDVGERPNKNVVLKRKNTSLPYGPLNFYWHEKMIQMTHESDEEGKSKNPHAIYMRKKRKLNPEQFKSYDLKRQYGITLDQYNEMLEKQGGVCAMCGRPEKSMIKGKVINLAVDHCHETGRVRGLLCSNCNIGIGNLRHDVELLQKAIEYVRITSASSYQPFTP